MSTGKKKSGWRQKFLDNRMALERMLFEKELVVQGGKESLKAGLTGLFVIWLLASALLAQWIVRQGYFFSVADADGFRTASSLLGYFGSGSVLDIFMPVQDGFGLSVRPPLYYLTYVPVLKFLTGDLRWALILVNSLYLAGLLLAVFFAVKRQGSNQAAWLSSAFAAAMPFVLETARHPDHRLAAMAFTAAAYAAYIRSEDLEHPLPSFLFGLFCGLGLFSDAVFWVYILPLLPFLLRNSYGQPGSASVLKGFLPGALLSVPWYLFAGLSKALEYISGAGPLLPARPGIARYLSEISGAVSLPLFLLGGAALLWMYFSAFMPYASRKTVAAWFLAPVAAVYLLYGGRAELTYPALLSMCVAVAVITPLKARKYLIGLSVLMVLADQSGLAAPVTLGGIRVAGGPRPARFRCNAPELLSRLKSLSGAETSYVALIGEGDDFNHVSLNYLSDHLGGPELKFGFYPPDTFGIADLVVYKTAAFASPRRDASAPLVRELSSPWFSGTFHQAAFYDLPDTSRLIVYAKRRPAEKILRKASVPLSDFKIGGLRIDEGRLVLSGFDQASGVYEKALLSARYAEMEGFDVYGLKLEIDDFAAVIDTGSVSGIRVTGAGSVRIVSATTSGYSLERYLSGKFPEVSDLEVNIGRTVRVMGLRGGRRVYGEFALDPAPSVLRFRLRNFSYAGYSLPGPLPDIFTFERALSGMPCEVLFDKVEVKNHMLEIS